MPRYLKPILEFSAPAALKIPKLVLTMKIGADYLDPIL
jgi:hypothetical protein